MAQRPIRWLNWRLAGKWKRCCVYSCILFLAHSGKWVGFPCLIPTVCCLIIGNFLFAAVRVKWYPNYEFPHFGALWLGYFAFEVPDARALFLRCYFWVVRFQLPTKAGPLRSNIYSIAAYATCIQKNGEDRVPEERDRVDRIATATLKKMTIAIRPQLLVNWSGIAVDWHLNGLEVFFPRTSGPLFC